MMAKLLKIEIISEYENFLKLVRKIKVGIRVGLVVYTIYKLLVILNFVKSTQTLW